MGPPVRLVCIECLESVELGPSESGLGSESGECPHCGAVLDFADAGIASRVDLPLDSPATVDMSDASTLRSDQPIVTALKSVGRFQVRQVLGEGGYGQVFRAYDSHLEREVALKVLKPNRLGPKALERFFREARAAARLDHPGIVGLFDAGRDEGRCWIAYQLVSGRTLSAVRDLARPSVPDSLRIVRDLALALHHAHGRGVFHRDLKPANVIIDDSGRPRLTDFGLARRDDIDSDLTAEGTVLGTPQYMSPEAAAGRAHEADARSDVYSLGVILYELLCGKRPCDLPSGAPLWRATPYSTPPTPRSVDRTVSPALDRICMKALAFDPADRHPDALSLADALTEQLSKNHPSPPRRGRTGASARLTFPAVGALGRSRRNWAALALGSVLIGPPALFWLRPASVASPASPGELSLIDSAPPPDPVQVVPALGSRDLEEHPPAPTALLTPSPPTHAPSNQPVPVVREAPTSATPPATQDEPPSTASTPLPEPPKGRVVRSPNSTKFHHPNCQNGPKNRIKAITYASVAEATAAGYSACEHCRHSLDAP